MLRQRCCEAWIQSPLPSLGTTRCEAAGSCVRLSAGVACTTRTPSCDQLKTLRIVREEASISRAHIQPPIMREKLHIRAAASEVLVDRAQSLFNHMCTNPKVVSPEAAEFMLSVSASHNILSLQESEDASFADLVLRGVHPASFGPVLLVCTTTMLSQHVEKKHVEKAQRRAELWQKAVGPSFSIVPVVAGFELQPDVAQFAEDRGVVCCDVSR